MNRFKMQEKEDKKLVKTQRSPLLLRYLNLHVNPRRARYNFINVITKLGFACASGDTTESTTLTNSATCRDKCVHLLRGGAMGRRGRGRKGSIKKTPLTLGRQSSEATFSVEIYAKLLLIQYPQHG